MELIDLSLIIKTNFDRKTLYNSYKQYGLWAQFKALRIFMKSQNLLDFALDKKTKRART
tara:strand:+ start:871 stop:1047 length:177 start_codon:yes stop_codon:yes gene_type:complete